tara:strand:+ start:365 stop:529 length:165 start_codon:yes stop_codon:yes gene_type:complete
MIYLFILANLNFIKNSFIEKEVESNNLDEFKNHKFSHNHEIVKDTGEDTFRSKT